MGKQTIMDRYQIGEPVARFGSATAPIFQAFDSALNRDVWIEVYKIEDHATKSWMYDWIRKQVIMNNANLQSVYDVFDEDECMYVVGESLRNYTTFKSYLDKTVEDDRTILQQILQVLTIIIEISKTLHNSYQLTLERVLLHSDSIKIIPRCRQETVFAHKGKMQPFLFLQMVYQSTLNRTTIRNQIEQWLHHAERHMQIIDSVDLQLWQDALDKLDEMGLRSEEKRVSDPVLAATIPGNHIAKSGETDSISNPPVEPRGGKKSFDAPERSPKRSLQRGIRWIARSPLWLRILVATCLLIAIGWFGYNALNPTIVIPDMTGKSYMEAVNSLQKLGIDPEKIERIDTLGSTQKPGMIFAQDPQAGSRVRLSSSITLQVAKGNPKIAIPSVVGMTLKQAKEALVRAGFSQNAIQVTGGASSDKDIVYSVTPAVGSQVQSDQTVVLDTSTASQSPGNTVVVPNLTGLSMNQAIDILLKSGLRYYYETHASNAPSNTVYQQSVQPGQFVDKGSRITFFVAR